MCSICCEDWSAKVVKTECPYCKFAICQKCMQTYMLDLLNDPKCMHPDCKKLWTMDHLFNIIPKSFIKGPYKKHRESVLYNREVAMLPATQPYLEDHILKKKISDELDDIDGQILELRCRRSKLLDAYRDVTNSVRRHVVAAAKAAQQYVGRCGKDDCKGFVSKTGYACGICETKYCDNCFAIKPDGVADHVCKPEDVLTFKATRKDSKPCPTCAVMIHRTSGCPMMFCTQCNTAWDWNTFKITTNEDQIHNPHYFEWRAANPVAGADAPNAGPCGAEFFTTRQILAACAHLVPFDRNCVVDIWGLLLHIQNQVMNQYREHEVPSFNRNLDLRIKFLNNEVDEKHFKSIIHKREKASNKKREILQILEMFHTVTRDLVVDLCQSKTKNMDSFLEQINNIVTFADQALLKASARYDCITPVIRSMIDMRRRA